MAEMKHTPTLREELVAALKDARFAIEATDACLRTWNGGLGGPANIPGILAKIDAALSRAQAEGR
jgi:hypothetical protein